MACRSVAACDVMLGWMVVVMKGVGMHQSQSKFGKMATFPKLPKISCSSCWWLRGTCKNNRCVSEGSWRKYLSF